MVLVLAPTANAQIDIRRARAAVDRLPSVASLFGAEPSQARAMIYLKRHAGVEMVQLARDLEALRQAAGARPVIIEAEVRNATGQAGWTPPHCPSPASWG